MSLLLHQPRGKGVYGTRSVALIYMPVLGLAVGSFLNLNIDRVPRGISIVSPPSQCDGCERRLTPFELVPLLSYLWVRGRCRHCGVRLPIRVFVVEAATGALFGLVTYYLGLSPGTVILLAFGSLFLTISFIDLEWTIIPDALVIPGALLGVATAPFGFAGAERDLPGAYVSVAAGGAVGLAILLLIYVVANLVYRYKLRVDHSEVGEDTVAGEVPVDMDGDEDSADVAFGFGDVKLGALIGMVVGFPEVLMSLSLSFLAGGVLAVFLLLLRLKGRGDAMPYGPFLAGGAMVLLILGQDIGWYWDPVVDWYLDLLP